MEFLIFLKVGKLSGSKVGGINETRGCGIAYSTGKSEIFVSFLL